MSGFGHLCRLGLGFSIGITSAACDGCRRDHPFTPFVVSSAGTNATPSTVEVARPHDAGKPEAHRAQGEKLAPNTRQFALGPRQPEAPASTTIDSILRADWNEDGNVDALALMRANPGEPGPVGAVYLYGGSGDARKLLDLPGWLPSGADCGWDTRLIQVGARSASVDVHVHCNTSMPPRTPTRFVSVVSPYRTDPLVIGWRLAEPAPGETFTGEPSLEDRDGDGSQDISLALTLGKTSGGESARGEFVWLDRTAGLSRASGQLLASLEPLLTSLDKKASAAKTAPAASAGVDLVWRLLGHACAQSGTVRLFGLDGVPIGCDSLSTIVPRLTAIEIRASLAQNDVLRAAFAASKSRDAFGTSQPNQDFLRMLKPLRKACTIPERIFLTKTEIRPVATRQSPHFSPLQFLPSGVLLVMTPKGVLQIQADGHELADDADATTPSSWPLAVVSPDGRSWEMLMPSCDRSEIALVDKAPTGTLLAPDSTNLLAPRPGLCAGRTALNWHVSPLRFDDGRPPLALVEGACTSTEANNLCLKLGKPQPGGPLSPDGRYGVAATNVGLFVWSNAKPELWENPDLGNLEALSDCVVSNGGDRVACIRAGRVVLLSKSNPNPESSNSKAE